MRMQPQRSQSKYLPKQGLSSGNGFPDKIVHDGPGAGFLIANFFYEQGNQAVFRREADPGERSFVPCLCCDDTTRAVYF